MAPAVDSPIGPLTPERFQPEGVRHQAMVGPKFVYALFNPRDRMHIVARTFLDFVRDGSLPFRRLVINDDTVDEAATQLKRRASMGNPGKFLAVLDESALYHFEPTPAETLGLSMTRFSEWSDLEASFTDFVIATHMEELEIDHLLTFDRHFEAFEMTTLPY